MQKFISELSEFAGVCKTDLSGMRDKEKSLDNNFKSLQGGVKKSILNANRPNFTKNQMSAMKQRHRLHPDERPLPRPTFSEDNETVEEESMKPMPFPTRHYALRAQPSKIPERFYKPKAREQLQEDRLELIDEYMKYPTPNIAKNLDGRVDPVLHVGVFDPNELHWTG